MKKVQLIMTVVSVLAITSCSKKDAVGDGGNTPAPVINCATTPAKFAANVSPIILNNCATGSGCHGSGSSRGPGALTDFAKIKDAAAQIKNAVVSKRMPQGGSLSQAQINAITCWVESGSLNN
jgi:hypothetical protein